MSVVSLKYGGSSINRNKNNRNNSNNKNNNGQNGAEAGNNSKFYGNIGLFDVENPDAGNSAGNEFKYRNEKRIQGNGLIEIVHSDEEYQSGSDVDSKGLAYGGNFGQINNNYSNNYNENYNNPAVVRSTSVSKASKLSDMDIDINYGNTSPQSAGEMGSIQEFPDINTPTPVRHAYVQNSPHQMQLQAQVGIVNTPFGNEGANGDAPIGGQGTF